MRKESVGRGSGWCVFAAILAASAAAPAGAQEATSGGAPLSPREQARELYEAGAAAFDAGDYGTAREKLQRSYELFASLRTLYSLGVCQHALGDFGPAVRSLEQYLSEAGAEAPAELRVRAEGLLAQMRAELGRLEVRVNADGAAILVDGTAVGTSPLAGPFDVGPGWHVVEAQREGWTGEPQRVNVATGTTASVALVLEELPPEPVAPVPPPPPTLPESFAVSLYGPPAGVPEKDWYGISDSDYQTYVFSTGRHQPLANWILERNRENPDLDLGIVLSGSQGPAWLLIGTLVYVLYEEDLVADGSYDVPWMAMFTWLLGSALTSGAIIMLIVDALDIGQVAVEHPERLTSVPAGMAVPTAAAAATAEAGIPIEVSFGLGGLVLRF